MKLEIKDVSYSFDGKQNILENMNFHVDDGEFVTILGPSAAVKVHCST